MKKFLVLLLALTFVFSFAAFAVADDGGQDSVRSMKAGSKVTIGGDARIRGTWQKNYNMTDTPEAADRDVRSWDQRVRLKIDAAIGNGIELRTRLETGNDEWHGTSNTRGGSINVDYAYLHIPVGTVVVDAGLMKRNWGNKLLMWDVARDTFQVTTNVGDTQIGVYTDKVDENSATGADNLDDTDNYGIFVNHTAGDLAAGLHIIREDDNVGTDTSGTEASVYLNTSVGAIGIAAEAAYKMGEMNEDSSGNKPFAAFIYASTDVGAISIGAFAAVAKDSFAADSHLTPSVFFGTDNPTAIANVQAAANSTTKAFAISAATDVTSDLTVNATLFYADLENLSSTFRTAYAGSAAPAKTGEESVTEIDLGLSYKLADNATYTVALGYLMPDNITALDDEAIAIANKIQVSF